MPGARPHILVGEADRVYFNGENPTGTTPVLYNQPVNIPEWGSEASKVTFEVRVKSVGGAPASWSLGIKTQLLLPHTTGNNYQYPVWFDLDEYTLPACHEEGVGWSGGAHVPPVDGGYGTVADQTDTLPLIVKRTITNFGLQPRILLNPVATGGTSPYLHLSIVAITHD